MVKITSPLMSSFAHGTLGSTLQFRGGPGGTIGIALPRSSKSVNPTLISNSVILSAAHRLWNEIPPENQIEYWTPTTPGRSSLRIEYVRQMLLRWKKFLPLEFYGPTPIDENDPAATTLGWDILPEPDYPNIVIDPWTADDFITVHFLRTISETPGPKNIFHAHSALDAAEIIDRPHHPTNDFWIQACTWKMNGTHPTLSNKLLLEV